MSTAADDLFKYLIRYQAEHKRLPTIKQVAFDFDRERSTASRLMAALVEQGRVEKIAAPISHRLPGKRIL